MPKRKKLGDEKSLPRGNIILWYPIPLKFAFSSTNSDYKKIKEELKRQDLTLEKYFHKRLMAFFDATSWVDLSAKNDEMKKIQKDAVRRLKDEMGVDESEFSRWFISDAKEHLGIK